MTLLEQFMGMCIGSGLLAFFIMLIAANLGRILKLGVGEEI